MPHPKPRKSSGFKNNRKGGRTAAKDGAKLARQGGDLGLGPDKAIVSNSLETEPPDSGFRSGGDTGGSEQTASPSSVGTSAIPQPGPSEAGFRAGVSQPENPPAPAKPKAGTNSFGVRQSRSGFRTG